MGLIEVFIRSNIFGTVDRPIGYIEMLSLGYFFIYKNKPLPILTH